MSESVCDKACAILQLTEDGEELSPPHLYLLQCAVNGHLTEKGEVAFEELYQQVQSGNYRKPWLCDVENVTMDHEGYVYWKGVNVDHYSFRTWSGEREAALDLAWVCEIRVKAGMKPGWYLDEDDPAIQAAIANHRPRPQDLTDWIPQFFPGQTFSTTLPEYVKEGHSNHRIDDTCVFEAGWDWLDSPYERHWHSSFSTKQDIDVYAVIDELMRERQSDEMPSYEDIADRIWTTMVEFTRECSVQHPENIYGLFVDQGEWPDTPVIAFVRGEEVDPNYREREVEL